MTNCVSSDEQDVQECESLEDITTHQLFVNSYLQDYKVRSPINRRLKSSGGSEIYSVAAAWYSNYLLLWGCRPTDQTDPDTTIVAEIIKTLTYKFDEKTLTI